MLLEDKDYDLLILGTQSYIINIMYFNGELIYKGFNHSLLPGRIPC